MVSFPKDAKKVSSPSAPFNSLLLLFPVILSSPLPPWAFSIFCIIKSFEALASVSWALVFDKSKVIPDVLSLKLTKSVPSPPSR